jgi:hypothetical protein
VRRRIRRVVHRLRGTIGIRGEFVEGVRLVGLGRERGLVHLTLEESESENGNVNGMKALRILRGVNGIG